MPINLDNEPQEVVALAFEAVEEHMPEIAKAFAERSDNLIDVSALDRKSVV